MSLLIKGMDMPRNKGLFYDLLLSLSFDGFGEIFFNGKSYPIAEISAPHGRLIDADRLLRKCQNISTQAWKMKLHADVEITMNQFIDFVKQAPTIIEAETNKNNIE